MGKAHDESYYAPGKRYGRLVILYELPKDKRKASDRREIVCKCDCGEIASFVASRVFSGNTKSCGCLWRESLRKHNVIGKRFGRLVVLEELEPKNWNRRIKCKCDCGKEIVTNLAYLLYGNTKSCGCFKMEMLKKQSIKNTEDITGQVFEKLTAIKKVDSYYCPGGSQLTRWLFKCSCGKEVVAFKANVKKGYISSCGHHERSRAEEKIGNWLTQHDILFEINKGFEDLRNPETGRRLLFDFKIYKNDGTVFLIEHQGSQHFTNKTFGKQQREQTDQLKRDYCKIKGITLYETLFNEDYIRHLEAIIQKEFTQEGDAYECEVING